jgi:methylmalonyl-CoA mutase N-terminal domain/subunit
LHTNGYDEALGLPTESAAGIALRTQQIIGFESGIADTTDPLGGSYLVESLTSSVEQAAWDIIRKVDEYGGSVAAIEEGFIQNEIAKSAYQQQREVETGEKTIVGVNAFQSPEKDPTPVFRVDDSIRKIQTDKLARIRTQRDHAKVDQLLQLLNDKASSGENIMPVVVEAVEARCTLGEIADTLREVFGEY